MLEIKSLLLAMRAGRPCPGALDLAARLARRHGAQVGGLCAYEEPELELSDCYAIGPDAAGEVLDHRASKLKEIVGPIEAAFRTAMAGLEADFSLVEADEPAEVTALRARCADLVVAPTPDRHDSRGIGLAETLIQAAAVPCLVAPPSPHPRGFERVLIAWNGSGEARRAIEASMGFLKSASAVEIVCAGQRFWPGQDAVAALWSHLKRHGVDASVVQPLHARGSKAELILKQCASFGADLLVMGGFSHARVAEDLVGGTTRSILLEGALPVLMAH